MILNFDSFSLFAISGYLELVYSFTYPFFLNLLNHLFIEDLELLGLNLAFLISLFEQQIIASGRVVMLISVNAF